MAISKPSSMVITRISAAVLGTKRSKAMAAMGLNRSGNETRESVARVLKETLTVSEPAKLVLPS